MELALRFLKRNPHVMFPDHVWGWGEFFIYHLDDLILGTKAVFFLRTIKKI